jgi:sarcosine oxidase subunit gamma
VGVYPVLREDWCLALSGPACNDVLVQVCNVQFAAVDPAAHPVIMTLMVGVAVLVVPQALPGGQRCYRIWCDPTFGMYLHETLHALVLESGGISTGVSA